MHANNTPNPPSQRTLRTLVSATGAAILALIPAACGGGGGSAGAGPTPKPKNQGSYTIDEFQKPPAREPGFQPLGTEGFQALSRDELFVITPTANAEGRLARLQDDPAAGGDLQDELVPLFAGQGEIHAAAFGQLDKDADDELLVATVDNSETRIDLHLVERSAGGGPLQRRWIRSIPAKPYNFEDLRLRLADLDGDFVDEILLCARSANWGNPASAGTAWVLDDPASGAGALLTVDRSARHIGMELLAADVDGDGELEVVLGLAGDTTDDGRYAISLYERHAETGELDRVHGWIYLWSSSANDSGRIVVGDFDDDGDTDIAQLGTRRSGSQRIVDLRLHEFQNAGGTPGWSEYARRSFIDVSGPAGFGYGSYDLAPLERALGGHDLAVVSDGGSSHLCYRLRYDRGSNQWSNRYVSIRRSLANQTVSVCGADVDADGEEEIYIALLSYPGSGARLDLGVIDGDASLEVSWQPQLSIGQGGAHSRFRLPLLSAGDFDADGLAVQFTGNTELKLGDPIPLVVLAAAPTQAGISQNYNNTESAYSTGSTQGESIGVSNYTSITTSVSTGATLFGVLGVEGRAAFERGVTRTSTSTQQQTVVRGYRGAYDDDVIVFQGTLYETYEYRIVGAPDPGLVGTLISLDLPVGTNTYKWTVDYYNQQVALEDQIGKDLLTHNPGDAASYPNRGELDALIGSDQHWDMSGSRPVGQGNASDFESVSFETVQATEEERSISRSYGGGASFGVSVSVDKATAEGSTHGVFYGSQTSFEASVGDIADPDDYSSWNYNWGFAIHTVGRDSSGSYGPRKHSFQYLRFWVDPKGSGY